jgi:ABC-type uncharacterized transport system YnjBCD ATPase subunit
VVAVVHITDAVSRGQRVADMPLALEPREGIGKQREDVYLQRLLLAQEAQVHVDRPVVEIDLPNRV